MQQNQKIEDYMRVICRLQKNGVVRGAYIARELGVTKPTVSVALREMQAAGYLKMQPNRTVVLTETGEAIGKNAMERIETLYGLLIDLGLNHETANTDACRMAHGVSEATLNAFKELRQFLQTARTASSTEKPKK